MRTDPNRSNSKKTDHMDLERISSELANDAVVNLKYTHMHIARFRVFLFDDSNRRWAHRIALSYSVQHMYYAHLLGTASMHCSSAIDL